MPKKKQRAKGCGRTQWLWLGEPKGTGAWIPIPNPKYYCKGGCVPLYPPGKGRKLFDVVLTNCEKLLKEKKSRKGKSKDKGRRAGCTGYCTYDAVYNETTQMWEWGNEDNQCDQSHLCDCASFGDPPVEPGTLMVRCQESTRPSESPPAM